MAAGSGEARQALGEAKLQAGDVAGAALESEQTQSWPPPRCSGARTIGWRCAFALWVACLPATWRAPKDLRVVRATTYGEALAIIEPLARDSNDERLLQPWAAALKRLGRTDDSARSFAGSRPWATERRSPPPEKARAGLRQTIAGK